MRKPLSTLSGLFSSMKLRAAVVLGYAIALLAGCSDSSPGLAKADIIAADQAFSAMSVKVGAKAAFLEYLSSDAKMLSVMRQGKDGVSDIFMQLPPTATLSWEPAYADISSSGDLGYTWGRYTLIVPSGKKGNGADGPAGYLCHRLEAHGDRWMESGSGRRPSRRPKMTPALTWL
jgi:hypothetical protein